MVLQKLLAKRMKSAMAAEHLTVPGVAQKAGIAVSSAQEYLHGKGNPRADTIELIYASLGLPLEQLIENRELSLSSEEPPDFLSLAGSLETVHPLLMPFILKSYQMAKEVLILSDALYNLDGNSKSSGQ